MQYVERKQVRWDKRFTAVIRQAINSNFSIGSGTATRMAKIQPRLMPTYAEGVSEGLRIGSDDRTSTCGLGDQDEMMHLRLLIPELCIV
jgi:hypothetical protein